MANVVKTPPQEVQFTKELHTEFLNYLRSSTSGSVGSNINVTSVGGVAVPSVGGVSTVPVSIYNTAGLVEALGGGGSATATANFRSPSDLTATYLNTSTLTLSALKNFTITQDSQIVYVKVIPSSTASDGAVYINGSNDYTFRYSGGILTAYKEGAIATIFVSGDNYEVGINAQEKAFSADMNANMHSNITPNPILHTSPEPLATAQTITTSIADLGTEISVIGINKLGIYVASTVGDATEGSLYVYGRRASGGSNFTIDGVATKALWTTATTGTLYQYYEVDTSTLQYLIFRIIVGTSPGTAATITAYVDKKR